MTTPREHLLHWLKDAHAMEQQAESMLRAQSERLDEYPVLRTRIIQHIDETRGQRQQLEECLKGLGEEPSSMKDAMGKMMAMGQTLGGMMASDEPVKGAMAGYVFEHGEIASYVALISAAEAAGEPHVAQVAHQILEQERQMADWLAGHLPEVVKVFLSKEG